jgi:hypothetical protein
MAIFYCVSAFSQEEIGYTPSNYSGVQGLFLNPAKGCDSKVFLDVNLVGLDLFVHNNYVHYDKNQFYLWKNINTGFPNLSFNSKTNSKTAQIALNVTGPSVHLSVSKHSFGIFTRARSYTSARIEKPLFTHIVKGFKFAPQLGQRYNLDNMYLNSLTWLEYGLSYGYIFHKKKYTMISAGANLRYLTGINSVGLDIENLDYEVVSNDLLEFYNYRGQINQAAPALGAGKGVGIDIGVEYKQMLADVSRYYPNSPLSGCRQIDYKWKAGASLLDIGFIRFNQNASSESFNNVPSTWNDYDAIKINSWDGLIDTIDVKFNPQGTIQTANKFAALLPMAVSAQFDYNFENNVYINASAIFGPRIGSSVRRGGLLAVVPRYERKRFELSLPVSLWDFRYPQIGFQLRLNNNLVIGSDRAMPFLFRSDVYGFDIYFHLKFSVYRNPACKSGKKGKGKGGSKGRKKGGRGATDCPAYR